MKGREVVSIVPQAEVKMVVKDPPPAAGGSKVQTLKGSDYVRVWFNKAGNHYLVYLPGAAAPPPGSRRSVARCRRFGQNSVFGVEALTEPLSPEPSSLPIYVAITSNCS